MPMTLAIPPDPDVPGESERRAETRRRRRMMDGDWREEAEDRLADFFAPEVREFLPDAELSRNAHASYSSQIATLYDESYTVTIVQLDADAEGTMVEIGGELLAIQQDCLRYVVGCNDAALRLDPRGAGPSTDITHRVVTMDLLYVETDAADADRIVYVEEDRPRRDPVTGDVLWTKERWDIREETPTFSIIVVDSDGRKVDRTADFLPDAVGWPEKYTTTAGAPIIPYVLYHRYVSAAWATPYRGMELVEGTLTVAALWTMWVAGVRDGAFPARVVVDGAIQGGTVDRGVGASATKSHVINPLAVLRIKSEGETRSASFGQFQPTIDPKSGGEAIEQFEAGLAVHAGLSPTDVTRGSTGQSGYSLVVSREGQRRQQARLRVPMARADAQRCAMAAALLNRAGVGGDLPEDPARYRPAYAGIPVSPEEVKADLDRVVAMVGAGLMTRAQAYMELHPGASQSDAAAALAEIDNEREVEDPPPSPEDDEAEIAARVRAEVKSRRGSRRGR